MPLPAETLSPFSGAGATRNENKEFCSALWRVTTGAPSERRCCQLSFLLFRHSNWSSKFWSLKAQAFQVQNLCILLDFLSLRPPVTIFPWGSPLCTYFMLIFVILVTLSPAGPLSSAILGGQQHRCLHWRLWGQERHCTQWRFYTQRHF